MAFKTKLAELKRQIKKGEDKLAKLIKREERSRQLWTKEYQIFTKASEVLAGLKVRGTKKEYRLKGIIAGWRTKSIGLTQARDEARKKIRNAEKELHDLQVKSAQIVERDLSAVRATDEVVMQVFSLNDTVVVAAGRRNEYLKVHIFPDLFDDKGNLRSQITFDSSDGRRRVRAMVNTMTIVDAPMAAEAKAEIDSFFVRIQAQTQVQMDDATQMLYDLAHEILVEKTSFKVGPELYRFLTLELDEKLFPELCRAQSLLKRSIRSEKTSSYIRLFERDNRASPWRPVAQS
jgi:hypothetical protein